MGFSIGGGMSHGGPGHMLHHMGSREAKGHISGRVLLRLLRFVRPYWPQMLAAMVLMLIASGAGVLAPYLTKVAIDENIADKDVSGLIKSFGQVRDMMKTMSGMSMLDRMRSVGQFAKMAAGGIIPRIKGQGTVKKRRESRKDKRRRRKKHRR